MIRKNIVLLDNKHVSFSTDKCIGKDASHFSLVSVFVSTQFQIIKKNMNNVNFLD